jgi:prepilin signal peptidase PulO-like enzyme (type II secretory pathway)
MEFKTEVSLLLIAITLFAAAMFFYSYQNSFNLNYPYRGVAIAFAGFGSVSMLTASISYSKRSKNIIE